MNIADYSEEELMDIALEAGAEDFTSDDDFYQISCAPTDFDKVRSSLTDHNIKIVSGEFSMIPKNTVSVTDKEVAQKIR